MRSAACNFRTIRAIVIRARPGVSDDSHMRRTLQPILRSVRLTTRSRRRLAVSFLTQNSRRVTGILHRVGCQCQKSPSTKTATFRRGNTKSGFPKAVEPRRHPVTPYARKSVIRRTSVSRLPWDLIAAITAERFSGVNTSGILDCSCYGRLHRDCTSKARVSVTQFLPGSVPMQLVV
jgi:hypothetical protein